MPDRYNYFKNWNDLHIVLKVAEHGGFARAAKDLGIDQTTVANRVSDLETSLGRRLFSRRTSGAEPTAICLELLDEGLAIADAMRRTEERLNKARTVPPRVTIAAPEGLLSYTIKPALQRMGSLAHPLDLRSLYRDDFPPLGFTTDPKSADVAVWAASESALPPLRGAYQVRRLGNMLFRPFATDLLAARAEFRCDSFQELRGAAVFDMRMYGLFKSLDDWNGLCARAPRYRVLESTRDLQAALAGQAGVTLCPTYANLYESRIVPLDIDYPRMAVSLWLSAHEDNLREPQVRKVYDALGDAFERSPWLQ